jgi:hypothetical protein
MFKWAASPGIPNYLHHSKREPRPELNILYQANVLQETFYQDCLVYLRPCRCNKL